MPIRDLNFSVWFTAFEYLPLADVCRFGLSCKLGHVLYHRQRHATSAAAVAAREDCSGGESNLNVPRFLGRGRSRETVALVSYPRCGNSLVRSLLEKWTGVLTGSDTNPMRTLGASLLQCGYMGEGVVDSSVWIVKTHYPERKGYLRFFANRAIVVVRNPFDSLLSYFHLGMTNTHDRSLSDEAFDSLSAVWGEYIVSEARTWVAFMQFWLDVKLVQKYPCQFVRYEDLVAGNYASLQGVMDFLTQGKVPIGLNLSGEAKQFLALKSGYKPRPKGKKLSSLDYFSVEQIRYVQETTSEIMKVFGYELCDGGPSLKVKCSPCDDVPILSSPPHAADDDDSTVCSSLSQSPLVINGPADVRNGDDRFGRGLTTLRMSRTDNDTKPFPLAT